MNIKIKKYIKPIVNINDYKIPIILSPFTYAFIGSFSKGKMFEPIVIDSYDNLIKYFGDKETSTFKTAKLYLRTYSDYSSVNNSLIVLMRIPKKCDIDDYCKAYSKVVEMTNIKIDELGFPDLKLNQYKIIQGIRDFVYENYYKNDIRLIL